MDLYEMDQSVVDWSDSTSLFNLFDVDNSGTIDSVEVLGALTCALDKLVTASECAKLFKEFDADHDGVLEVDEFETMVEALKKKMGTLGHRRKRLGISKNRNTIAVREAKVTALVDAAHSEEKRSRGEPLTPRRSSSYSYNQTKGFSSISPKRSSSGKSSSNQQKGFFSGPSSDSSSAPTRSAPPDSLDRFVDLLPDEALKKEAKKFIQTLTPVESKDLFALAVHLSSSSSSSSSSSVQVALLVNIVKHRLTPDVRVKIDEALSAQSGEGSEEMRKHAAFAFEFFDAADEATINTVAGTALDAYAVYSRSSALEKRPEAHDFVRLFEYDTVFAALNVIKSLPLELRDEFFALFDQKADEPEGLLSQAIKVGKAILSQPADHLARIFTPALETAAVVAELSELAVKQRRGDEKASISSLKKTLDQNALMEDRLQKTSKLVATAHLELMALPRELTDAILATLPEDTRKDCLPVLYLTEGMAKRDVEELFITMASEAFPKAEKPPSAPFAFTMHGLDHGVGTSESRKEFEQKVSCAGASIPPIPLSSFLLTLSLFSSFPLFLLPSSFCQP